MQNTSSQQNFANDSTKAEETQTYGNFKCRNASDATVHITTQYQHHTGYVTLLHNLQDQTKQNDKYSGTLQAI
jgi:hypothetical protein